MTYIILNIESECYISHHYTYLSIIGIICNRYLNEKYYILENEIISYVVFSI